MAKCIFISMGFKDKTEHQIQLEAGKAATRFKEQHPEFADYKFITNYDFKPKCDDEEFTEETSNLTKAENNHRRICLAEAIRKMSICKGVLFVNNWPDYSGCRVERTYAEETKLPCYEIDV